MTEHEIFECLGGVDGIVINDLFDRRVFAEYDDDGDATLKIELMCNTSYFPLNKTEMNALIGFLTYVRSKMD